MSQTESLRDTEQKIRDILNDYASTHSDYYIGGGLEEDEAVQALLALMRDERIEAQLEILRGFRRRDFVRDDFYEAAVIDRITQLSQQSQK